MCHLPLSNKLIKSAFGHFTFNWWDKPTKPEVVFKNKMGKVMERVQLDFFLMKMKYESFCESFKFVFFILSMFSWFASLILFLKCQSSYNSSVYCYVASFFCILLLQTGSFMHWFFIFLSSVIFIIICLVILALNTDSLSVFSPSFHPLSLLSLSLFISSEKWGLINCVPAGL